MHMIIYTYIYEDSYFKTLTYEDFLDMTIYIVYSRARVSRVARKHPRCFPMMELDVPEQRSLAQLPLAAPGGPLDGLRK